MHLIPSFRGPLWFATDHLVNAYQYTPEERKDIIHTAGHVNANIQWNFKEVSLNVSLSGLSDLPFKILSPSLSIAACDHADMVSTQ